MTEPTPDPSTDPTTDPVPGSDDDMSAPPPSAEEDPTPTPEPPPYVPPTPDPPPDPEPIVWEPQTWYEATAACRTPGCIQENVIVYLPMLYSNNGDPKYIRVVCADSRACGKDCVILTATKLDPQPIEE
ncbi:hypothetical protein [Streptomyces mexicanus]|uniref:hypothetical protein n=1 Tax=Streptomyces mexicanus TaxID=178566 RepID=UPI00365270EE